MSCVVLSALDSVIPPCFTSNTWILKEELDKERIVNSLKQLCSSHYPLLLNGELSIEGNNYVLQMLKEPEELFVEEDSLDEDVDLFGEDRADWPKHNFVSFYDANVPCRQLVRIRMVKLRGGFALSLAIHHNVLDGLAYFEFVATWRRFWNGRKEIERPVSFDRSCFSVENIDDGEFGLGIGLEKKVYEPPFPAMHTMILNFTRESIEALKKECEGMTRNDVVSGVLWNAVRGPNSTCYTVVDVRKRLKVEHVDGNACVYAVAKTKGNEKSLSDFASSIHDSVQKVTAEKVRSVMSAILKHNPKDLVSVGSKVALSDEMVISNWTRFDIRVGPFKDEPIFSGPLMPSSFSGLDGIVILTCDRKGGINAFVSILSENQEKVLSDPMLKKFSKFITKL